MNLNERLDKFLNLLEKIKKNLPKNPPLKQLQQSYTKNPYTTLMVTLLSLRTKDERTAEVAAKLFKKITTPQQLLQLSQEELEEIIRPLGFYKQKARTLREVSKVLVEKFNSQVPNTKEELLSIKGVGEKTANVVLNSSFNQEVIAVDVHVHRLVNMWKIVDTKTPLQTSHLLNQLIPSPHKKELNTILVAFGQTICTPKKPKCLECPIENECKSLRSL